jgi:hypothetical protein
MKNGVFWDVIVLTRATRRNIPEDTILHSHRRENLKSFKEKLSCARQKSSPVSVLVWTIT